MRKLFSILFVFALTLGFMAGEKRIVGARVNNQVMLLRVDLANYHMDCSTDGTDWSAVSAMSEIADNALSLAKLVQIPTASVLGNTSGSTANATILSASDLKTLIGNATTSAAGLMSSADKTTLGSRAASGANSDITSLTGLTTALSITQGGTGLSALGAAGQVLAVNAGATALEFTTVSGGSGSGDVTGPSSATDGHVVAFDGITGKIIKDSGITVSGLATSGANGNITSLTGLTTPLSVTQGGTGLSALGAAGQVLAVNSGATALEFATISATSTWDSITGKPIDLTDYSSSYNGHSVKFRYSATGDIDSNCKLMLHFDNNATDVSENAVTVTAQNSPTYSTGVFNQAITFNGTSQYISFPAPFTSIPATGFTFEFRFKTSSAPGAQRMIWFSETDPYQGGLLLNTDGTVSAWFYDGSTMKDVTSSSSVCDGNWHALSVSVSGTTLRFFVNGISQGAVPFFETFSFGSTWYVARRDSSSSLYCACSIDELRISNAARYTTAYTPKASAFSSEVSKSLYVDSDRPADSVASSETTVTTSYTADYDEYTIHRIKPTASTVCALTVQHIPLGKALVIRVDNTAGGSVTFGGNTIISSQTASIRFLSFTNVTGTIELVQ